MQEKPLDIAHYEILTSKTLHKIPVVNHVQLHSLEDPLLEAKKFIHHFEKQIQEKRNYFVLGLGFGHHLQQLALRAQFYHQDQWEMVVVEPNQRTIADFHLYRPVDLGKKFDILTGPVQDLYSNEKFVRFLSTSPVLLSHPQSIQVYEQYFKDLFSFRANDSIEEIRESIKDPHFKIYLQQFHGDYHLIDCLKEVSNKKSENKFDYLLLTANFLSS